MESKLVVQSKTIIGIVLATLVLWAPQVGIDFTQEDSNFLMENLDKALATFFTAFAAYGRIVADTKVRFLS